ncbi:hypothetical protein QUF70_01595 [Desulfobacterales bacterium HSG17]|nr:hypothetical protein [Desulfobacterales bacterium HSG17]
MKFTDWHRLFGITLTDFFTDTKYTVELEKDLSLKKQFLDVVIIEKKDGTPVHDIPDGLENLEKHNLLSYKSHQESFDDWSADELTGHYVNYRKQVSPSMKKLLPKDDFKRYAVCTRFPAKLAKQANLKPVKNGVYDLRWGIQDIRLIVTSQIEQKEKNAVWLMFSAVQESVQFGVSSYRKKLSEMSSAINKLISKYQTEGIIAMPYTIEDFRNEIKEDVLDIMTVDDVVNNFPAEEIFKKFSTDQRLKGISVGQRLKGISVGQRLKGISEDEIFEMFSPEKLEAYLKKQKPKKAKREQ